MIWGMASLLYVTVHWKSLAAYSNKMKYERAYDSFFMSTSGDQYEGQKIIA